MIIRFLSWKDLGKADLVNNISSNRLSTLETEALNFGFKIATGIRNHDIRKLINIDYRHNDSYKRFIQGIIGASTNCHTDELTIPKRCCYYGFFGL